MRIDFLHLIYCLSYKLNLESDEEDDDEIERRTGNY